MFFLSSHLNNAFLAWFYLRYYKNDTKNSTEQKLDYEVFSSAMLFLKTKLALTHSCNPFPT